MTTAIIDFIFILLYYLHRKKSIDVNSVGHHDEFYGQLSHHENGVQRTQSRNPQLTKLFKWPTQNVSSNDNFLQINSKKSYLHSLQRNSLYRAAHIANFEGILGFSVPSVILVKARLMAITMLRARPA